MILKNTSLFFNRTEFQQSWNGNIAAKGSTACICQGNAPPSLIAHGVTTGREEAAQSEQWCTNTSHHSKASWAPIHCSGCHLLPSEAIHGDRSSLLESYIYSHSPTTFLQQLQNKKLSSGCDSSLGVVVGGSISQRIKKLCGSLLTMHDCSSVPHHPQMLSKGWEEEEVKIPASSDSDGKDLPGVGKNSLE